MSGRALLLAKYRKGLEESGVPEHMWSGIIDYIMCGTPGGSFQTFVFESNLVEAAKHADEINMTKLHCYAKFLYNYAPIPCWGTPQKVCDWERDGGLSGLEVTRHEQARAQDVSS